MPLDDYIALMEERACSGERQRLQLIFVSIQNVEPVCLAVQVSKKKGYPYLVFLDPLDDWIRQYGQLQLHVCLEAAGSYSDGMAHFLSEPDYTVSVLNPVILVTYCQSKNTRYKND